MTTLAIMKARIASELRRPDLTTTIAAAINSAIAAYQTERFRFSDSLPNAYPTFATEAARSVYTSADLAGIGTLFAIDEAYVLEGNMQAPLVRRQPGELFTYNQTNTMQGYPDSFAYEGDQIILSPVPAGVYTITVRAFRLVAAPTSDDEAGNAWMTTGEALIRARAKFEVATHYTRDDAMARRMSPDDHDDGKPMGATRRAWLDLKGQSNRVTGTGRVRSMQF